MSVQLAQQVQAILGPSDRVIITERVDDVALLIGQMVKMALSRGWIGISHGTGSNGSVSWGWTAVIWLAYSLTEGDHRKGSVEADSKGRHHTLSHLSGQAITPLDCSDDRWGPRLQHWSKPNDWHGIERDLNARRIEVMPDPGA